MIRSPESWEESRFFVPNEDAAVARAALAALPEMPKRPAFVCGSGMLLLDVMSGQPTAQIAAVDISSFQIAFFRELRTALRHARCAADMRSWFACEVYPQLREHYLRRGQLYTLSDVYEALDGRLAVRLFSDESAFAEAKAIVSAVTPFRDDMVDWLCRRSSDYDFVHLSNIVDYLPQEVFPALFSACRARRAPVLFVRTTACDCPEALRRAWRNAGYAEHPVSAELNRANRALGARHSEKPWIRTGEVSLLVCADPQ